MRCHGFLNNERDEEIAILNRFASGCGKKRVCFVKEVWANAGFFGAELLFNVSIEATLDDAKGARSDLAVCLGKKFEEGFLFGSRQASVTISLMRGFDPSCVSRSVWFFT